MSRGHTFRFAAQQNVYTAKDLDSLSYGGATAGHASSIAANATDAIPPSLAVSAVTLTLANKLTELGTASLVVDLVGRQAGDDIVAVVE